MKILKQLLFTVAVTLCFSTMASAQKQDDKKPPKDPPVVVVKDKKDKPKEDNQNKGKDDNVKRPEMMSYRRNDLAAMSSV